MNELTRAAALARHIKLVPGIVETSKVAIHQEIEDLKITLAAVTAQRDFYERELTFVRAERDTLRAASRPRATAELAAPTKKTFEAHKRIKRAIFQYLEVTADELASDSKTPRAIRARFAFYYIAHRDYHLAYTEIGRRCGDRDHSAVRSGALKMQRLLDSEHEQSTSDIAALRAILAGEGEKQ